MNVRFTKQVIYKLYAWFKSFNQEQSLQKDSTKPGQSPTKYMYSGKLTLGPSSATCIILSMSRQLSLPWSCKVSGCVCDNFLPWSCKVSWHWGETFLPWTCRVFTWPWYGFCALGIFHPTDKINNTINNKYSMLHLTQTQNKQQTLIQTQAIAIIGPNVGAPNVRVDAIVCSLQYIQNIKY